MRSVVWALFGNDDGGIYGEHDDAWVANGNTEQNAWTAIRWWLRNPFHNLCWHVIDWPRERAFVLFDVPGGCFYYRRPQQWLEGDHVQVTLAPFYIGLRCGAVESYAGWRDADGRLGFAIRKSHSQ